MITKTEQVMEALENVAAVQERVFPSYPDTFNELPCISFYEANNSPYKNADDSEYLTEINMVVDIWAESILQAGEIAVEVDKVLNGIGFSREFSKTVPESGVAKHKTMRFKYIGG